MALTVFLLFLFSADRKICHYPVPSSQSTLGKTISTFGLVSKQIDIERFMALKSSDINSEYYIKINESVEYIKS